MQLSAKVKHHYCCVCCFQRFSSENLSSRWKTRNNISLRLIYNAKSHENARVIRIHRQEWCDYFNLSGKHFCGWRQSYWQRGMAKATPTQGSTWMNSRSWVRPLESTSRVFSLTSMSVCKMASVLSRRLSVSWVDSRCSFSWSRVFFSSITSFCSLHRKSHDIHSSHLLMKQLWTNAGHNITNRIFNPVTDLRWSMECDNAASYGRAKQ